MEIIKVKYQNQTGLFQEYDSVKTPTYVVRATIPVVEKLKKHKNIISEISSLNGILYKVQLSGTLPDDIIACHTNETQFIDASLRLQNEPEYPNEYKDYWKQVDWLPCPECSSAIIWYEAGYVPGYRICSKRPYHHCLAD